ncbi:ABC transporter ATP-binding protein [Pseudoalteromonas maricaloris]|uniref:ABC transporter ATP-binding protein n=1 Tax=Pseudoalteromonas maricaloris TaxID=184924 RepID=UPI00057E8CA3|nr:ABC transporter ATP-binding protein [Pseudoalteromonas flavipulchra]KID33624.1 ABC transporter [Pseudoalteromonas flavipulchra NCIMB 2033 = ATCC BAA-314]MBD0781985.1 ABC transporter ATP-binding protein [Pseudoalteromonas flavipulchra]
MNNTSSLIQLVRRTRPSRLLLSTLVLFTLISSALGLLVPLQTKKLLEELGENGHFSNEQVVILIMVLVFSAVLTGLMTYIMGKIGNEQKLKLRGDLFQHLIRLPVSFFDNTRAGEPANRIVKDTEIIENLVSEQSVSFISGVVSLFGSFIILWFLDWQMTLVMLGAVTASFLIILPFSVRLTDLSKSLQDTEASMLGRLTELFANIRLLRAQGAEKIEAKKNNNELKSLYKTAMSEHTLLATMGALVNLVIMASIVLVLGFGASRVANSAMTLGAFVAFIMFLLNIVLPMGQLSMVVAAFNKAKGAAVRINEILATAPENESGHTISLTDKSIYVRNLSFSYVDDKPVFKSLSCEFLSGKTTAIVGPSGVGKSTLFALLQGFYPVRRGYIEIAGLNVEELDRANLRAQIGYVAQESPLLCGTLHENLVYGADETIDDGQLQHAIATADLAEFIATLPDGLNTQIGERGITLSGGQRQRVALARALLKDPALLLLDEATASLDSQSEAAIQIALKNAKKGRTTIIAAHRLSTVMDADNIIVINKGEIESQGDHQYLMQHSSLYQSLVNKQFSLQAAS